jgi:hypothetical protein
VTETQETMRDGVVRDGDVEEDLPVLHQLKHQHRHRGFKGRLPRAINHRLNLQGAIALRRHY